MSNQQTPGNLDRREFAKASAAAAVAASFSNYASPRRATHRKVLGSNDSVRVGFIGVGNRGSQLMDAFAEQKDCQFVGFADVFEPYLDRAREKHGKDLMAVTDYRELLDRDDIDVIAIASPDHWHAIHAISAMAAGKDVYVEKPLAATIHEGRQMVDAAAKFDKIVQVGLHRRSMKLYHRLKEYMEEDKIGKITVSRAYRLNNMYPAGIGKLKRANHRLVSIGTCGLARAPISLTKTTLPPTSFAGGSDSPRRWETGACTTSTRSAG